MKGFGVSFLSDVESLRDINIDKTLVYIICAEGDTRSLDEDQIIYNYADIDSFIFMNEKILNKTKPLDPVEISKDKENTIFKFLNDMDDFKISTLYRDNSGDSPSSNIVLIKTDQDIFIPVIPLDESSDTWRQLNFTGNVEDLYINETKKDFNTSIKITGSLLDYCEKIKALSKITNFQLPIFIKNLNINKKAGRQRTRVKNKNGTYGLKFVDCKTNKNKQTQ